MAHVLQELLLGETFPTWIDNLYLYADGLTTEFTFPGITTAFVPVQTLTVIGDRFAATSIIPAVFSSYVTTISNANISSVKKLSISEDRPSHPIQVQILHPTQPTVRSLGTH